MSEHRNPQDSVSNELPPHNPDSFDPAEALESLHLEMVQVEALANAACEAVTHLPFPSDREERRLFDRVYSLVTRTAEETGAAVTFGHELIEALKVHLRARGTGTTA